CSLSCALKREREAGKDDNLCHGAEGRQSEVRSDDVAILGTWLQEGRRIGGRYAEADRSGGSAITAAIWAFSICSARMSSAAICSGVAAFGRLPRHRASSRSNAASKNRSP